MAKKPAPMKKLAPMGKAKPAPKAAAESAPAPKTHTRKAKPAEEKLSMAERSRKFAASYLVQRDGMDEDLARLVVSTMDQVDVDVLVREANNGLLERTVGAALSAPARADEKAPAPSAVPEAGAVPALPPIDFLSVPALADDDTFTEITIRCRDAAVTKNEAEKQYKADKKLLDATLMGAGVAKDQPVMCAGVRLVRYTGKSPRRLSDIKLLEKGVSIDIINACWEQGEYDDVRVTTPEASE